MTQETDRSEAGLTLPPPDLDLMDDVLEPAHPERPVHIRSELSGGRAADPWTETGRPRIHDALWFVEEAHRLNREGRPTGASAAMSRAAVALRAVIEADEARQRVVDAADALSKALRVWVLSGLNPDDWPTVRSFGLTYEKARAALEAEEPR